MENEEEQIQEYINEMKLIKLKIILNHKFNINYKKSIYDFFELFKIRVLKQIISENKYFNAYKKLYSLRNIFIKSLLKKQKIKIQYYSFYYWYIKAKLSAKKYNKIYAIHLTQALKRNNLIKLVLKSIIRKEKRNINIPIIKRYLFIYMKYYNYLTDNYYIKSITIVKAIFNYFRKKLKIYKAIFFSRIDYNIKNDDFIYIYKYILSNYIYDKENTNNDKRKNTLSLIDNCNNIIKFDYNKCIKILSMENLIYILLDKIIINTFFINKYISKYFFIWKNNSLEQTFVYNIQSKEILRNELMYSKILIFVFIVKKKLKKHFDFLYYKVTNDYKNKLVNRIKLEEIYNNILFNVLKGINFLQNIENKKKWRIYNINDDIKKIIVLKKWKQEKNVIYNNNYNDMYLPKKNLNIYKASFCFDSIFLPHNFERINILIKSIFNNYLVNIFHNYIKFKLNLFSSIIQKNIINLKRKISFIFLIDILKRQSKEKYFINNISFIDSIITKILSEKVFKYKIIFMNKIIYHYNNLENKKFSDFSNNINENSKLVIKNKNTQRSYKAKNKIQVINIFIKYYQKNYIKNNYLYSLKNCFIHWCFLAGIFPSFLSKTKNIKVLSTSLEKEEVEEIQAQKKEILEIKNSLNEDKDFQHDLKAKISALDEENNFVNEKIFEITQRVDNCQKCNNLIKSQYVIDNDKEKYSFDNAIKYPEEIDNTINKSRNMPGEREITSSSGVNFVTGGTEFVPKKPRGLIKNEELSNHESIQIEDEKDKNIKNIKEKIDVNGDMKETEILKQKILELKREKDPIVNKLKEEIIGLYKELNID